MAKAGHHAHQRPRDGRWLYRVAFVAAWVLGSIIGPVI